MTYQRAHGGTVRKEQHFSDRLVSCYVKRPGNIWEMVNRSMVETPDNEAIVAGDWRITYRELDAITSSLASNIANLGVGHGDRVATLLGNRPEFIFFLIACARLGAIIVPMGTRLQEPEIRFICVNSGADVLIHEASLAPALPEAADVPGIRERFSVGGSCEGSREWDELLAPAERSDWPVVAEEDIFCISYTSGTTGKPKGALLTHLGMVHTCLNYRHVTGVNDAQTAILATPGNHLGGAGIIFPVLDLGGKIILMPEFKARKFLELASSEKITYGAMVPAMFNLLLLDAEFKKFDLSSWKWGLHSGAPMPEATTQAIAELLPNLTLMNCYGATEATSVITIMPPGLGKERSKSVGRGVPVCDIVIVDEEGIEVPIGEPGELLVGGPTVVPGYWSDPEANASNFIGGYWRSGDIGSVDAEGFYSIHDRKKDMINRGGHKIFCAEVENVLSAHPQVIEAAVVAVPDNVLGERVHAFIVPNSSSLTAQEIIDFCSERLADYKKPEFVTFLDASLPRNPNGKIIRPALVAMRG